MNTKTGAVLQIDGMFDDHFDHYSIVLANCTLTHSDVIDLALERFRWYDERDLEMRQTLVWDLRAIVDAHWRCDKKLRFPTDDDISSVADSVCKLVLAVLDRLQAALDQICENTNIENISEVRPVVYLPDRVMIIEIDGNEKNANEGGSNTDPYVFLGGGIESLRIPARPSWVGR